MICMPRWLGRLSNLPNNAENLNLIDGKLAWQCAGSNGSQEIKPGNKGKTTLLDFEMEKLLLCGINSIPYFGGGGSIRHQWAVTLLVGKGREARKMGDDNRDKNLMDFLANDEEKKGLDLTSASKVSLASFFGKHKNGKP